MSLRYRIALQVGMFDPYWVQVREAVIRLAPRYQVDLISLNIDSVSELNDDEADSIFAELIVQNIDALIANTVALTLLERVTTHGIPIIDASESLHQGQLFTSRRGLYDAAFSVGQWLYARLPRPANILLVGGHDQLGMSRVTGFVDAFDRDPDIHILHVPCDWRYHHALTAVAAWVAQQRPMPRIHAIFGISDPQTFAGRDALEQQHCLAPDTLITGINGDPMALVDISRGRMDMTIETSIDSLAQQMLELAIFGIMHKRLPATYDPPRRIIDRTNVDQVALEKLITLSEIPNRLVGVNRTIEQQRLRQLETSVAITQRVGSILDHEQLIQEISALIKNDYRYDRVLLCRLDQLPPATTTEHTGEPPLQAVVRTGNAVFIPDTTLSRRFALDPAYPDTRTRVVLPIRINNQIIGLLDLHSTQLVAHSRGELDGLQLVANQIGIVMQNIDLYQAAKQAQQVAERADHLKTRLLANVSHELRTPLHIILGYSQLLLAEHTTSHGMSQPDIHTDVTTIKRSAEHLIHLINDLLDLSRAEIDELVLYPELTNMETLIHELFESVRQTHQTDSVAWLLECESPLPYLFVDATRVRQILTNVLSNAAKFTRSGTITLGVLTEPPYLHIWVKDTGIGISPDQQHFIFEPFVTLENPTQRHQGVGLGLAITRRLVALHRGILTVDSEPNRGSTFHISFPLRGLEGNQLTVAPAHHPALIVTTAPHVAHAHVQRLARYTGATVAHADTPDQFEHLLSHGYPHAIVWIDDPAHVVHDDTLRYLQTHSVWAHVPLLMYADDHRQGDLPILQKPFQSNQFIEVIRLLFQRNTPQHHHVVIIDDEISMHGFYHDMLTQHLGYVKITSCYDGLHAQHELMDMQPTFIILDLIMPQQDGFDTLAWIRSQAHLVHTPVLIISGKVLTRDEITRLQYPHTIMRPKLGSTTNELGDLFQQVTQAGINNPAHISSLARQAMAFIQTNFASAITREQIATAVGVSESYLTQVFQQELGITPWVYLTRYRITHAERLLRESNLSITDIAALSGFDDPGYFSKVFRSTTGVSPRAFRQQRTSPP
jgi:signal transduction histidine kinase/AraC-like DNA-binding protein/ABC-type sugar transport system substrate-binding protein